MTPLFPDRHPLPESALQESLQLGARCAVYDKGHALIAQGVPLRVLGVFQVGGVTIELPRVGAIAGPPWPEGGVPDRFSPA